jgi:proteasome lid subunit RPN8/RPN11
MDVSPQAPPADQARDAGRVSPADYPRREPPPVEGRREAGFQVVVRPAVLTAVAEHGRTTPDIEVCGVLVGRVYHDDAGPYLHVEASIRGEHAGNLAAQVTFTAETWAHIQAEMDRLYPDKRILGWYHTHPGFGIFLSDMDRFIHDNFFNLPWQVAYVYDPRSGEDGMFVWRCGRPAREPFLVEKAVGVAPTEGPVLLQKAEAGPSPLAALAERLSRLERRQRRLFAAVLCLGGATLLALALLFALAWAGGWGPLLERLREGGLW